MEVTYRVQEGYRLPNLLMPQEAKTHLGKYAELRRQYLMQHRRVLYTNLKTSGQLAAHLAEIEETAQRMVTQTVAQMAKAEGMTEELKAVELHGAGSLDLTDTTVEGTIVILGSAKRTVTLLSLIHI